MCSKVSQSATIYLCYFSNQIFLHQLFFITNIIYVNMQYIYCCLDFFLFERQRQKDLSSICLLLYCLQWQGAGLARPKLGAGNSIHIFHMGSRAPTTWAIIYCLSGCVLAGICNQEWSQDLKPGVLMWDVGVLITVPNACPVVIVKINKCL